jgi:hypothetical protein
MTTPRESEKLNGELEIDYQRNRVKFHPNALCESAFSLPLTPLDVDIVRSLTQISRRLETHCFRTIAEIKLALVKISQTTEKHSRNGNEDTRRLRGALGKTCKER